jgi:FdhE protein
MNRRIERAAELEQSNPEAAGILAFYRRMVEFQEGISGDPVASVEALLRLAARHAPRELAQSAEALLGTPAEWAALLQQEQTDAARAFFAEALLQPGREDAARRAGKSAGGVPLSGNCPYCAAPPLLAILRPEGEGGKRSLLCGRCFTEWEFRRLLCPSCGEEAQDKLAVFTAQQFPHIRVEACDTCRRYLKAIDLTRNGRAVPEVDELASVALDLWAVREGYEKMQVNLFGM